MQDGKLNHSEGILEYVEQELAQPTQHFVFNQRFR